MSHHEKCCCNFVCEGHRVLRCTSSLGTSTAKTTDLSKAPVLQTGAHAGSRHFRKILNELAYECVCHHLTRPTGASVPPIDLIIPLLSYGGGVRTVPSPETRSPLEASAREVIEVPFRNLEILGPYSPGLLNQPQYISGHLPR